MSQSSIIGDCASTITTILPPLFENDKKSKTGKKCRKNWRLEQLSQPLPRLRNQKFIRPTFHLETNVTPAALQAKCTMRQDHMARPLPRVLECTKQRFDFKGDWYIQKMDEKIEESKNSIYDYYKKVDRISNQKQ